MNRIGGKSNTGEGGEESDRYKPMANGDSMRSAIKQVASGRFGVTAEYLVNSDMMQIKMAQGAKPGEGGQLPGHKVDAVIAKVRHSTQGVGLISPPPHHDIYSIEDLKQLVFDLKNVNPQAARLGQARLRGRRRHGRGGRRQVQGRPRHDLRLRGRHRRFAADLDQACGLALGDRPRRDASDAGDERPALAHRGAGRRRRAHGARRRHRRAARRRRVRLRHRAADRGRLHHDAQVPSEHLPGRRRDAGPGAAQALRRPARACHQLLLLRRRGGARVDGRARLPHASTRWSASCRCSTRRRSIEHWKAQGLDFSNLFLKPEPWPGRHASTTASAQDHGLDKVLDRRLIAEAQDAIETRQARASRPADPQLRSVDRRDAVGRDRASATAMPGLRDEAIHIKLKGTAGQSFGALLAKGVTLELEGEANDYVGKGLSGGRIVVYPPQEATKHRRRRTSIIVGNTVLYGAIAGECYFRGVAGERFARAQFGRDRGRRGHGRSRLRIHDRRRRRGHRRDRAQFRRRHVGRHRLCARRGRRLSPSAATSRWSISSRSRTRRR